MAAFAGGEMAVAVAGHIASTTFSKRLERIAGAGFGKGRLFNDFVDREKFGLAVFNIFFGHG